jgi:protein SCO1
VLAVLLMLTACSGSKSNVQGFHVNDPDGMYAAVLPKPYHLPALTLTDSHGAAYALRKDTTKPLTLVFFGYTKCPDICLVVMSDITASVARLPVEDRDKIGMLFITSDPARDDPQTLRAYLDRFNPTFEGLTAPIGEIKKVGTALGVAIEKGEKLPSGGFGVAHGSQVVGVLPDGSAPLVWTEGTSSKDFAADIEKALHDGIPKVGQ